MNKWQQNRSIISIAAVCVIAFVLILTGIIRSSAATPEESIPAAKTPHGKFVGSETCKQCHEDTQKQLSTHFHGKAMADAESKGKGYLCEGCHGAGSVHAEEPSAETAAPLMKTALDGNGCISCHKLQLSASKWKRSEHLREGVGCIKCHASSTIVMDQNPIQNDNPAVDHMKNHSLQPHGDILKNPDSNSCTTCHGEKLAELSMPTHHPVKEGRIGCSDCHNPHQPMGKEMQKKVCLTCHANQKGPFRNEHGAISGNLTDACLDCHRPHGSPNQSLLKITKRGLCLQCHGEKVTHFVGRDCLNCHKAIHGSNSSRLFFSE